MSKNKLCFELYQQNLQCKISGRQSKEGNSQKLRPKWLLNLKYLLLRQLKSTSLESVQFHFFRIFEGKKKIRKNSQTLSSQLCCEVASNRRCAGKPVEVTLSLGIQSRCDTAAAQPRHSVLAARVMQLSPRQHTLPNEGEAEAAV